MKKFKYKFSNLVIVLLIVGCVLSVLCLALNILRIFKFLNSEITPSIYNYLTLILIAVLTIGFLVVAISIFISSYYEITDKEVILKWGIIKNIVKLKDIKEVKLFLIKGKLHLIFKDETFFIINVNEKWFDEFISSLKEKCPSISFIQISEVEK